ncbi:MAG: hypothetical protein M1830_006603, partial [Pleopsidium flavum]
MEQQFKQRQSLSASQPPPPQSSQVKRELQEQLALAQRMSEGLADTYISEAQAPGHSLTTQQQGSNSGGPQVVVHSTISQDQTAGIEVNDRQLFALLAKKFQISQVNDSTAKPEVSATGETVRIVEEYHKISSPNGGRRYPGMQGQQVGHKTSPTQGDAVLMQYLSNQSVLAETPLNSFQQQNPAVQAKLVQVYAQDLARQQRSALNTQVPK